METMTQRRVPASSTRMPASAGASSVFAMGTQAAQEAKGRKEPKQRHDIDINTLEIRKGIPLPPPKTGNRFASKYSELLSRMQPGDSVVLPTKAAHALMAAAKKLKVPTAMRALGDGTNGVWRMPDPAEGKAE